LHHVYDVDRLREAYRRLKRTGAAGVDGVTWTDYGAELEGNLQDLSARLRRGAYRPKPVRRTYIPKADGRERPIGVPTTEDRIVQRATAEVLGAVYEADFLGFSYGFRPGRSQHDALDALAVGIQQRPVRWVLDADIRGFFDTIDHGWLVRFLEHRIADKRIVRLVKKWLHAGVLEDGAVRSVGEGTPQGGVISPLLANIYLHYVFDLWINQWRRKQTRGHVIVVRYADDFVVGFQNRRNAEIFRAALKVRLAKFGLALHPDKTLLIEFGQFAVRARKRRGDGRPSTFDFLGFTHICAQQRNGRFAVWRKTSRKRMNARLAEVRLEVRKRMHHSPEALGRWLNSLVRGYFRYHGVPLNYRSLVRFRRRLIDIVRRAWLRRSQKAYRTICRLNAWAERWIPPPSICQPWPDQRVRV